MKKSRTCVHYLKGRLWFLHQVGPKLKRYTRLCWLFAVTGISASNIIVTLLLGGLRLARRINAPNHQTASAAFYSHAAPRTSETACTQA